MKYRKLIFILLFGFVFPMVCEAKICTVENGTGSDIGDEIACGSEHFYILESNDDTVKMLSKYNLYVGDKVDREKVDGEFKSFYAEDYDGSADDAQYAAYEHCESLKGTYGENNVEVTGKYTDTFVATEFFCRIYTPLEYEKVKQDELAIGLYPNSNNEIVYPIYGSVYLDQEVGEKEFDENLDMIPETSQFNEYLVNYKETLSEIGVEVVDIGFIKRSGLENTINAVSDKKISIPTYNPNDSSIDPDKSLWESSNYLEYDLFINKFNIKEYVPEKYKWLYGTSYWTGSATVNKGDGWIDYYDEFLSTVGDYCSYNRGCYISKMGLGLRPVVTINKSDVIIEEVKKIEEEEIEVNPNEEINPKTGDNFYIYLTGMISSIGLICILIYTKMRFGK